MKTTISQLKSADINAVDKLMKRNSRTLGFLTRETLLKGFIKKGGALGVKTSDGQLIGYLLYDVCKHHIRITHLCVAEEFGKRGIARQLVDKLKQTPHLKKSIRLSCRRDFPAHNMWPKLGFIPIDEKNSRSSEEHFLTLWCLTLAEDDQLSLFQAKTSDETLDVIIDAQIFFDLYEADYDKTMPAKSLFSDFLVESISLWITDELFVEIDRGKNRTQRDVSRQRAYRFSKIEYDLNRFEHFEAALRKLLPDDKPNQESDIRQLAKAAASDINIFVTRDDALLNKAESISELTGLQVLSPTELIIQLHELSERQSYMPTRVSGHSLVWRRLNSDAFADFPFNSFLIQGERKGKFREKLNVFLANPNRYECEVLWSQDQAIALRVLTNSANKILSVCFYRSASSDDRLLFERYLIVDTVYKAVERNLSMVKFEKASLTPGLKSDLLMTGFTEHNDSFVRFCFSRCLDRAEVLSEIAILCPESTSNYQNMSDIDLERHCSPLNLGTDQNYFLIPIRSGYAMSLINSYQPADDLFGGNTRVLLRWDHVYYRKKNRHKMLVPPGRILWYVSEREKQIVAVSHLDEVEIGIPQELFKKFKRFGILEWENIYELCDGDLSKEIMALRFSHTFPFRQPVSLEAMRTVFKEDNVGLWLQSPSKIPIETFSKLFQLGYPNQI